MLATPGRYKARVIGVAPIEAKNGNPGVAIEFACELVKQNGEWLDCTAWDAGITAYEYFLRANGSLNETKTDNLRKVFGWDGASFAGLHHIEGAVAQITVEQENYNGAPSMRVKWINHIDDEGSGGAQWDDTAANKLASALDMKLRAHYGAPARPPAPAPATAPAAPTAARTAQAAPTAAPMPGAAMDEGPITDDDIPF